MTAGTDDESVDRHDAGTSERRPFWIYAILVAALGAFSVSAILIRYAVDAPGTAVAVWRTVFASILLAPFALVRSRGAWKKFTGRDWALTAVAGIALGFHFLTWIHSIYFTTISSAAVLVSLSPVFMGLMSWLILRERLPRAEVIAIGVAVAGTIVLGVADARSSDAAVAAADPLLGNGLALTAALLVSIYLIIGRVVRRSLSWLAYVVPLYVMTAVTTLTAAAVLDIPLFGYEPRIYVLCFLMALIPQIVGHGSLNYLLHWFKAPTLGLAMLVEPIGASILAFVLFAETPTALAIVAMAIILLSVASVIRPPRAQGRR
ncbi:MAG: DMT family transporter [Rhodothermales bacterium]|nr:DMT family transporter [Rhodothermales bacterium]